LRDALQRGARGHRFSRNRPADPHPLGRPCGVLRMSYVLRRMSPDDAPGVCACARAIYGDAYPRLELYAPAALIDKNASGEWISMVALDGSQVVGHMALEPSSRETGGRVAEMGMGMVLAEHRRHGVLEQLRDFVVAESARIGLAGQFVELETSNL